jgi:hypothetical protein
MKKVICDGKRYLLIEEDQINQSICFHAENEKRAHDLLAEELAMPEDKKRQEIINMFAHQEIKARGFKEAWNELYMHINMKDLIAGDDAVYSKECKK